MNNLQQIALTRTVRFLVGPGLLAASALVSPLWAKALLVGAGWATVGFSSWTADAILHREDARRFLRAMLQSCIKTIEAARPTAAEGTLRANLMIIDKGSDSLAIALHAGHYMPTELSLRWNRGQGCAGRAWETGSVRVSDDPDVSMPVKVDDASKTTRPYGMSEEQITVTAERIKSVISAPVFATNDSSSIIGVVNLDDEKPLDASRLSEEEVRAAIEELASVAASFVEKARLQVE